MKPFGPGFKRAEIGVWQTPTFPRPDWCDKLVGMNVEFGRQANHPCTYWTADYGPLPALNPSAGGGTMQAAA